MGGHPLRVRADVLVNRARYEVGSRYRQWDHPFPSVGRSVGRVSEARFEDLIGEYASGEVFVHAGLGAIKRAFSRDPYTYLRDTLFDHFGSVLVPGFTPSFRDSAVYHKVYSRPEYGAFARQFLADAEYRTNDAIHSILVHGPFRFEEANHHDTFARDGCWAKLDDENVLYCNVGTPWIVSTQHHFLEHVMDVPYNQSIDHEGIIYYDETHHSSWEQRNYRYDLPAMRNAPKIQRTLREQGVLDAYNLNGLRINFFRANDLRRALETKIASDPYYLIR